LVTSSKRAPVHHLCSKTGFQKTCEFAAYSSHAVPGEDENFKKVNKNEIDQAFEVCRNSPVLPFFCGLIDCYWSWSRPKKQMISEAVEGGRAWWWGDQRGLLLFWEDDEEGEKYLKIQTIACLMSELQECLQDARKLTHRLGFVKIEWIASIHPEITKPLKAAGFENKWDMTLFLFEKERQ
jgi:hypothetical protein